MLRYNISYGGQFRAASNDGSPRQCFTNRVEEVLRLSPEGFSLRAQYGGAKFSEDIWDRKADLNLCDLTIKVARREALSEQIHTMHPRTGRPLPQAMSRVWTPLGFQAFFDVGNGTAVEFFRVSDLLLRPSTSRALMVSSTNRSKTRAVVQAPWDITGFPIPDLVDAAMSHDRPCHPRHFVRQCDRNRHFGFACQRVVQSRFPRRSAGLLRCLDHRHGTDDLQPPQFALTHFRYFAPPCFTAR